MNLNEFEHVDIDHELLVIEILLALELAHRCVHNSGKFGVHCHIGIVVNEVAQSGKLLLQLGRPNVVKSHILRLN